jgi:deoxyribodipyrimidine photolyase
MNVLWFRRGLRIHDNPALLSALENSKDFIALFVFDTTFQGILLIQICFIQTLAKYKFTYRSWIQAIPYEWILAGMLARFK